MHAFSIKEMNLKMLSAKWRQFYSSHNALSLHIDVAANPKKYAHGFCFAVLCCGYTLTDFPISIRLTSLTLWQSDDCPSASKATLMNMDKYFIWIHYERLHNHDKAKHNKTVCIFLGIYCSSKCFSPLQLRHMSITSDAQNAFIYDTILRNLTKHAIHKPYMHYSPWRKMRTAQ